MDNNRELYWRFSNNGDFSGKTGNIISEWSHSGGMCGMDHHVRDSEHDREATWNVKETTVMLGQIFDLIARLYQQRDIVSYGEIDREERICIKIYENGEKVYENRIYPIDKKDIDEVKQDLEKMIKEAEKQTKMR